MKINKRHNSSWGVQNYTYNSGHSQNIPQGFLRPGVYPKVLKLIDDEGGIIPSEFPVPLFYRFHECSNFAILKTYAGDLNDDHLRWTAFITLREESLNEIMNEIKILDHNSRLENCDGHEFFNEWAKIFNNGNHSLTPPCIITYLNPPKLNHDDIMDMMTQLAFGAEISMFLAGFGSTVAVAYVKSKME